MNGSEKRDASSELEQLLQKCKKTFTDQDELMRTLLQAVWWVKEELEKKDVTIKKHEAKLLEQDLRINALEKELAKPLPPVEAVEKVAQAAPPAVAVAPPVVPPAVNPTGFVVPQMIQAAKAAPKRSAPTPATNDLATVDLLGDIDFTGGATQAAVVADSDPLMTSDPWRGENRPPMSKASPASGGTRPNMNKAAQPASRQTEDSKANQSEPLEVKKSKAMPVQIRPKVAAKAPTPSASMLAKLQGKAAEKANTGLTVAALAEKAQSLMEPPEDVIDVGLAGTAGPPGPPSKAAPEAKSSTTPVGAVPKAVNTRPPAKAPPTALLKAEAPKRRPLEAEA